MSMDEFEAVQERDILYELFIYSEWVQEPELITKFGYGGLDNFGGSGVLNWFLPTPSISAPILWHRTSYPPWQLSLSPDNRLVAVLKENCAEIRSTKDDFATVVANCQMPNDPLPQFRCLSWSSDTTLLAISSSTGRIVLFDLAGEILYTIDEDPLAKLEGGGFALVNMLWTEERIKKTQWSYEMITVTFNGQVRGYFVNSDTFSSSFQMELPIVYGSIGAAVYHPLHSFIVIGTGSFRLMENADATDPSLVSSKIGISAWKLVAEEPHLQKVESIHQETPSLFSSLKSLFQSQAEDAVCSLSISPSGTQLLCLHSSGVASLWSLPGLILMKMWRSFELPAFKATNPHLLESEKLIQEKTKGFHNLIHVDWWTEEKMIIVRRCGSICIVSIESGRNLLGENPEWFGVAPRLTTMSNMGLLTIECEWQMGLSKTRANSSFIGSELETSFLLDSSKHKEEQQQSSWLGKLISIGPVRKIVEYVTDINLQEDKPRRVVKIYRLLGLKSTTPQELFVVKINNGEYTEALDLAKRFDLDSDPVYQHQWRKSDPNKPNIDCILHKVKNKSWVLQECLQKLSSDPVSTRELLLYGLRVTNIIAITKTPSNKVPVDVTEEQIFQKKLIQLMNFEQLSLEQKWMIECRRKFLRYLDALQIYESFADTFDPAEMAWFRQQSPLEAAVHFARQGRFEAVVALLTFYTPELSKHWLPILNQIPETTSPDHYAKLLPYATSKPPHKVRHWHGVRIRTEIDWAEKVMKTCPFAEQWNGAEEEFYEKNPDCREWRCDKPLEIDFVAKWYLSRIRAIEASTLLTENALDLVRLAYQKLRPQGNFASEFMKLQDNLLTLEKMTFDCRLENVTLKVIEQRSTSEQLKMIMQNATESNYLTCVRRWLLPFVERCERSSPGEKFNLLKNYFAELAEDRLDRVVQVWELLREAPNKDLITNDLGNQIEFCITCCKRNRKPSQLEQARFLLNSIPKKPPTTTTRVDSLFEQLDMYKNRLAVAECLAQYGTVVTISQIESLSENSEEAYKTIHGTFLRLVKHKLSRDEWFQVASNIFGLICSELNLERDRCAEAMCEALIRSMNRDNIYTTGCMLSLKNRETELVFAHRLDEKRSLDIVLQAARAYFDSATTYTDPCVGLAKSCLSLIQDADSDAVQKELKLIESLPLLNKFGIQMLPVHVRSQDKLTMIKEVLVNNQANYRNFNKIHQLAQCLGFYDENPSHEGLLLSLVAEVALKERDYCIASNLCQRIIQEKHVNGWKACAQLGSCEEFQKFQERKDLLGFCLAHAPSQHLEIFLNELRKVELQEYYNQLEQKFFQKKDKPLSEPTSLMKNIIRPDAWLGSVTDTVKKGFTVRNSFMEETSIINDAAENRFSMILPSLSAFYHGLWEQPIIESRYELTFSCFETELLALPEVATVLQYASVSDRLNGTMSVLDINDDMLLSLSQEYMINDVFLAICYLLQLSDAKKAEKLFLGDLPYTKYCLQIGSYFFALSSIKSEEKTTLIDEDVFACMNRDKVLARVTSTQFTSSKANVYKNLVSKFIQLESDLLQAQLVQEQSGGTVDVGRFGHDEVYKKETILGMAFSDDVQNFRVAVSLARHYQVSLFEVCFGHLEHLFLTCTHSSAIENRLQQGDLLDTLRQEKNKFETLLKQKIFPILIGTNYDQLKIYFNLILECSQDELQKKKTESLIALLNEVDVHLDGIDFKLLISSDVVKQREALSEIVNIDNIDNIAKICARFKSTLRFKSKSTVIQVFLKNEFVSGGCQPKEKLKDLFKDYLKYIGYLTFNDVIDFIKDLCFDALTAEKKLSRGHRLEILKIFVAFAKHKSKLSQKTDAANLGWENTQAKLSSYMQHLQSIEYAIVSEKIDFTDNPLMEQYVNMFEMTAGEQDQVMLLLINCILSECNPSLVKSLLSICPASTVACTPLSDLFLKATAETLRRLRNHDRITQGITDEQIDKCSSTPAVRTRKPIAVLKSLLVTGKKITEDRSAFDRAIVDLVRDFCLIKELQLSTRLAVLRILRDNSSGVSDDDEALLLHLETMTLIQETWPEVSIAQSDTETPQGREMIFNRLLAASSSQEQLDTLCSLLSSWPPLNVRPSPWYQILIKKSEASTPNASELLSIHRTHANLNLVECQEIEKAWAPILSREEKNLFRLETKHRELHEAAVLDIDEQDLTEPIKDRILHLNLSSSLVSTSHYKHLMNHLLKHGDSRQLFDTTMKSLTTSGFFPEAASLYVLNHGLPKALQTFSESLAYFNQKYEDTDVIR